MGENGRDRLAARRAALRLPAGLRPHPLDDHGRRLLLLAGALLAGALALYGWIKLVGPMPGDRAASDWYHRWRPWEMPGDLFAVVRFFDTLATPWIAAGTILAAAAVAAENVGRRWAAVIVASAAVVVLNATLKHLLGPTPLWREDHDLGLNYPSGHVAYATAVFGTIAWVALRHRQRALAATAIALVVAMGIDRIVSRLHLPSDVVAGYLVGGAWLCLVIALGRPRSA